MDQQVGYNNKIISPVYRDWYEEIFRIKGIPFNSQFNEHPHTILRKNPLLSDSIPKSTIKTCLVDKNINQIDLNILYTNTIKLERLKIVNFNKFFDTFPPISNGNMYLDKGNTPRVLNTDQGTFIVVKVNNLEEYVNNYFLLKSIIERNDIKDFSVVPEIGFIKTTSNNYFISLFEGNDFEIEILLNNKHHLREKLIDITKQADELFMRNSLFVRNLAPRNLIFTPNKSYLIDYDNVFEIIEKNYIKIWELQISRRIWFGDVLEPSQIDKMFKDFYTKINLEEVVSSDHFEEKFFMKKSITLKDRAFLYDLTTRFERYSIYEEHEIYGHQLGRFISDFWNELSEVELLRYISQNSQRIEEVRAILFIASRLDQEILFYNSYGEYLEIDVVSERLLKKIVLEGWKNLYDKIIHEYNPNSTFLDRYKLFKDI